jgi:FkbM family methyltransferase
MDVGAFHGGWTETFLRVFPDTAVTCVEPQPKAFAILKQRMAGREQVCVMNALLGAECRDAVPFEAKGPGSSVLQSTGAASEVRMQTLDAVCKGEAGRSPDYLKLDVQGFELEVLKGGTACLETCRFVQCELSLLPLVPGGPLAADVMSHMKAIGFVLFDVEEFIRAPSDDAIWQVDVIFCREDDPLRVERRWR